MLRPRRQPMSILQDVDGSWHLTTWAGGTVPLWRPRAVMLALIGHWRAFLHDIGWNK